jgi:hypothetical protein
MMVEGDVQVARAVDGDTNHIVSVAHIADVLCAMNLKGRAVFLTGGMSAV